MMKALKIEPLQEASTEDLMRELTLRFDVCYMAGAIQLDGDTVKLWASAEGTHDQLDELCSIAHDAIDGEHNEPSD